MNDSRDRREPAEDDIAQGLPPAVWISVLVAIAILVLLFLMRTR